MQINSNDHLFISYARADGSNFAQKLDAELSNMGLTTWRDTRGIDPSQDFTSEIEKAIQKASHVIAVITPDTIRDNSFVRRELSYASLLKKPILVARFSDIIPPIHIVTNTWIDLFNINWSQGVDKLLDMVRRYTDEGYTPPEPHKDLQQDPFRENLQYLYQDLVDILDQTVYQLIEDIETRHTPALVGKKHPNRRKLHSVFKRHGLDVDEEEVATLKDVFDLYKGRLALLGQAGSGKSTSLYAFARDVVAKRLADPKAPLPIFARCADWQSGSKQTLAEWLSDEDLPKTSLEEQLADGRVLLLLDGLDELGTLQTEKVQGQEQSYDPRVRFVEQLPENNQIVLSCRVQDFEDIDTTKSTLNGAITLQPLKQEQIKAYLADSPNLLHAIQQDARLLEIVQTPLFLSIITFAYHDAEDELKSLANLNSARIRDHVFLRFVRERYRHEQLRNDEELPFQLGDIDKLTTASSKQELLPLLGRLAMENIGQTAKSSKRYHQGIEDNVLIDADFNLLFETAESTSEFTHFATHLRILRQWQSGNRGFVHLLLRDALAHQFSKHHLYDVALYNEQYGTPGPALALGRTGDENDFDTLLNLAKSVQDKSILINVIQGLGAISDQRAADCVIGLYTNDEAEIRQAILFTLTQMSSINITNPNSLESLLVDELKNEQNVIPFAALRLAKEFPTQQLRDVVFEMIPKYDRDVWGEAVKVINAVDDQKSFDICVDWIQQGYHLLGYSAAMAFAYSANTLKHEALVDIAKDTKNIKGRHNAIRGLGELKNTLARDTLIVLANSIKDEEIIVDSIKALGNFDDTESHSVIIQALKNTSAYVRANALDILKDYGNSLDVIFITSLLFDTEVSENLGAKHVCTYAASALSKIGGSQALDALLEGSQDASPIVRQESITNLRYFDGDSVIDTLRNTLGDSDPDVQLQAIKLVGRFSDVKSVPILAHLSDAKSLNDGESGFAILRSLRNIGTLEARDVILNIVNNIEVKLDFRQAALEKLTWFKDRGTRDAVIKLLPDENVGLRWRAAWVLRIIGDADTVPHLIPLLDDHRKDRRRSVRSTAAFALKKIGTPEALAALEAKPDAEHDDDF